MTNAAMNPITEDDIANFLVNTPDFFERHAELLSAVRLTSPHSHRAVSLQERQAEMMREKIRALELRMMDMMRHGTENEVLIERMQRWVKTLLMTTNARDLPHTIADQIQHDFMVPQVAIKVWGVGEAFQIEPFAQSVIDPIKDFAASLTQPYVGINNNFDAVQWLPDPAAAQSVATVAASPEITSPVAAIEPNPGPAPWAPEAEKELAKIPFFVRGKARRNTERYALERGVSLITIETLYDAKANFSR